MYLFIHARIFSICVSENTDYNLGKTTLGEALLML